MYIQLLEDTGHFGHFVSCQRTKKCDWSSEKVPINFLLTSYPSINRLIGSAVQLKHMILSKGECFVTLRDISQGLVTAPRSHAVIIMDLRENIQIYFLQHLNFLGYFVTHSVSRRQKSTCTCLCEPSRSSCTLRCWPAQRTCFCSCKRNNTSV